ncbi:MAG: hypothetical protein ACRDJN_22255 [Chloroflexota bacterium]
MTTTRAPQRWAIVTSALVLVLGFVVPDSTALVVIAYLMAIIGPVVMHGLAAYRSLRRWPDGATVALPAASSAGA